MDLWIDFLIFSIVVDVIGNWSRVEEATTVIRSVRVVGGV